MSLYRIAMHVIELFVDLPLAPNVQVIEAPLPDAVRTVKVYRGRERQAVQHLLAPRALTVLAQGLECGQGRTFLQALDDARRIGL